MHIVRRVTVATLTLFLAGIALVGTGSAAQADPISRYWIYYSVVDGAWKSSDLGFGATTPEDGSVEGYRYGATAAFPPDIFPRADLAKVTFDEVCDHVDVVDGKKRVAVVIDFGVEEDADGADVPEPYAACAQVAPKATGLQVLQSVAKVKSETSSFGPSLCKIDGYPAKGKCFGTADAASPADTEPVDVAIKGVDEGAGDSGDDDDSNVPLLVGAGLVVVALGAGGVVLARRGRS